MDEAPADAFFAQPAVAGSRGIVALVVATVTAANAGDGRTGRGRRPRWPAAALRGGIRRAAHFAGGVFRTAQTFRRSTGKRENMRLIAARHFH